MRVVGTFCATLSGCESPVLYCHSTKENHLGLVLDSFKVTGNAMCVVDVQQHSAVDEVEHALEV